MVAHDITPALGIHARHDLFRHLSLMVAASLAFWCGYVAGAKAADLPLLNQACGFLIGIAFVFHVGERWNRHVGEQEAFFHS